MRLLFAAAIVLSGALAGNVALAQTSGNDQTQACYDQARRQVLSGEDLVNFMARCQSGQSVRTPTSANAQQSCIDRARLLSGEDKVQAMRACAQ